MKKIAFAGYCLSELPCSDESDPRCARLRRRLFCEAQRQVQADRTIFLSGMANDAELWAAEAVLQLKNALPLHDIQLWAVSAYGREGKPWTEPTEKRYYSALAKADHVIEISDAAGPNRSRQQSRRLIDEADHLIAVHDGRTADETREIIDFARRKGLVITIIEP